MQLFYINNLKVLYRRLITFCFFSMSSATLLFATEATQTNVLPEPLTLEYALSRVTVAHPSLSQMEANIQSAEADKELASARTGFNSHIVARLRYFEPSSALQDQSHDDHRLGIIVDKTLYDFGRTGSLVDDANSRIESERLRYQETLHQRRINIMRAYFDVLLADVQFYRYNEEMAVEYINYDKLQNRHELGQVSDLEVIEAESKYRTIRKLRAQSQGMQRITRSRLAYAMGHAGDLPTTVSRAGDLPHLQRPLPEVEILQQKALDANPTLRALRAGTMAAKSRIEAAEAGSMPLLIGSAEANAYSRVRARNDAWRVNLILTVPITTGGSVDAATAKERAGLYQITAELADHAESIKQQVLELWLKLESLRLQRDELTTHADFRELSLDRNRALYEMEVKTDLGDAMVKVTETEYELLATEFNIVLVWEQLDAITGMKPIEISEQK